MTGPSCIDCRHHIVRNAPGIYQFTECARSGFSIDFERTHDGRCGPDGTRFEQRTATTGGNEDDGGRF